MPDPTFSPWGEIQTCEMIHPGIYSVSTPGHGGIMVENQFAFLLSPAAKKCGFRERGYLCFEEDSQADVILRELLDKELWKIPGRIADPAQFEQNINKSLQMWNPTYWKAREAGRTMPKAPSKGHARRQRAR